MILATFDIQVTLMLPSKFEVNWPFSSGEAKNRFSDGSHGNAYGSKLDLAVKRSNVNVRQSFLATLVDLLSLMSCAQIQPQDILGSGEEDF